MNKTFYSDSVAKAVSLAEHYKAIGYTEIELFSFYNTHGDDSLRNAERAFTPLLPWDMVTKVESGSSYRYNVPVDMRFTAKHPSGLTFKWSFYIEEGGVQARGGPSINVAALVPLLKALPRTAQLQVRDILRTNVAKMNEEAVEKYGWYRKCKQSVEQAESFLQQIEDM